MPPWTRTYVRRVEAINYRVGRFAMYLLFVIMAILLYSSFTKIVHLPAIWTLELAQFTLVAYYLLGAPYTFQLGTNVRMDLLYSRLRPRTQAMWDVFTIFCLMFYLGVMLYGAVESTAYSLEYGERNPSAWRPYMWPIKMIISFSFFLMLLQSTVHLLRDIAVLRGEEI